MAVPIVRVTSDRLPAVVAMSARAFIDEAMFRWVLGEVEDPLSAVEAEFAAMDAVAADLGCLWEADDALGAARWVSPEASPVYWERCKAFSSEGLGLAAYATDGGRRYELLYECLDSHEPSEPVWTLDILTVEPSQQRGGIGSALVEHGLALARSAQCASFLDTSRSELVGYYGRFGFTVDSEADLPDGGPHLWFMVARGQVPPLPQFDRTTTLAVGGFAAPFDGRVLAAVVVDRAVEDGARPESGRTRPHLRRSAHLHLDRGLAR